jgi:hypothetical protein
MLGNAGGAHDEINEEFSRRWNVGLYANGFENESQRGWENV